MPPLLLELLIHALHPDAYGLGGGALQIHIECRVDTIRRSLKIAILESPRQLLIDKLHKVRRIRRFQAAGHHTQGLFRFHGVLAIGDVAVLPHQRQNQVAPLFGMVGTPVGIVVTGIPIDPGERRGFVDIEVADVFSKIRLRRLPETVDAEAAALAEARFLSSKASAPARA